MITAHAKVTLTVEVEVDDTWGKDCSMTQVHDQASENAIARLRNEFGRGFTIVGNPKVQTVIVKEV